MLGEILLTRESQAAEVRVIDSKKSKREVSIKATGKLKNNVDVNIIVTYWNNCISHDVLYGEGQGITITSNDNNNNTWKNGFYLPCIIILQIIICERI